MARTLRSVRGGRTVPGPCRPLILWVTALAKDRSSPAVAPYRRPAQSETPRANWGANPKGEPPHFYAEVWLTRVGVLAGAVACASARR